MESETTFNGYDVPEGFPRDTPLEFMAFYFDRLKELTPEQRVKRMFALNARTEAIADAGIRHDHPDFTDEQVKAEMVRRMKIMERIRRMPVEDR